MTTAAIRTHHPREDHPLHDGGRGSLHVQVGPGDVLRGQQQEEEEGEVGRRVTDELDEGLLDEAAQSALRCQQVDLRRGRGQRMKRQTLERQTEEESPVLVGFTLSQAPPRLVAKLLLLLLLLLVYLFCSSTRCWQPQLSLSHASEALNNTETFVYIVKTLIT